MARAQVVGHLDVAEVVRVDAVAQRQAPDHRLVHEVHLGVLVGHDSGIVALYALTRALMVGSFAVRICWTKMSASGRAAAATAASRVHTTFETRRWLLAVHGQNHTVIAGHQKGSPAGVLMRLRLGPPSRVT